MQSVGPKSLAEIFRYLEAGGTVYIATYARTTVITQKTVDKFFAAGEWLLKEEGNGYRLRNGKSSVYLFPGQLKYGDEPLLR